MSGEGHFPHTRKPVVFRLFNNLEVGGVTSRLRQVLPLLLDEFDVHMVTYRKEGVLGPEFQSKGITVHHVPMRGKWNPSGLMRLARLFRECGADIVHTHAFGGNISGILAATLAKVPVRLGQVHTRQQHWYAKTELHRKKQRFEEYCVHSLFSHKVIFPSRAALEYFHAHCPVAEKKLYVLHNGIRLPEDVLPSFIEEPSHQGVTAERGAVSVATPGAAPEMMSGAIPGAALRREPRDAGALAVWERFGIRPDQKVLGFVGRLTGGKGVGFALSFMERLHRERPDHCLLIVGASGNEEKDAALRRQAEALPSGLVHFAGAQSDPYPFYRAFDGFFFPSESWTEAMPGTVLEAAAHGLPILARENPAVREVAEYYSGIYFMSDNDDPAHAVDSVYSLPLADASRLRENFSIHSMAEKTKALYRELLEAAGKG